LRKIGERIELKKREENEDEEREREREKERKQEEKLPFSTNHHHLLQFDSQRWRYLKTQKRESLSQLT